MQQSELIKPEEFEIVETYCFEDKKHPAGNYVIFGIRAINQDVKGILMTPSSGLSVNLFGKLDGGFNSL